MGFSIRRLSDVTLAAMCYDNQEPVLDSISEGETSVRRGGWLTVVTWEDGKI